MIRELHIRNMVCSRCIKVVRESLENAGLSVRDVALGSAVVEVPASFDWQPLQAALNADGFSLITDPKLVLTEKVKHLLIERLSDDTEAETDKKLSEFVSERMGPDYAYISKVFSKTEGVTLNRYYLRLKIEKVKELINYGELSFKEIAFRLGYSSLQHLSGQFTRLTQMSMSDYSLQKGQKRNPLDGIL